MQLLELKEIQKIVFELLVEFDEFCKQNEIDYVLCGGTLLGAIRHKGYIPWDDDADVMMMRDQYEKLLVAVNDKFSSKNRKFISLRDKTFARNFARYIRLDYCKKEEGFREDDCPWIGLDIFPVDFISNDERKYRKQVKKLAFLRKILLCSVTEGNSGTSFSKKVVKNLIRPFAKLAGSYNIAHKMEMIQQQYNSGEKEYIAGLSGMYGLRERWKYSDFEPRTQVLFEGRMFPAPENYDIYLTNLYGDYMQLPPEEKRKYTQSTVYKI